MGVPEDYYAALQCQLISYIYGGDQFEYIKDWSDVGQGCQEMVDRYTRGGDIGTIARTVIGDASSPSEKLRRLYDYVSDSIKFQEDVNGHWATNGGLGKLLVSKVGTGFEKNALLLALAREAGVNVKPMFIATRDHCRFDPLMAVGEQTNRMILFAQFDSTQVRLVDATSSYCPYTLIPPECLVDMGLLVDGKDSHVIKVGRSDPKTVREDVTTMTIDSAGSAHCTTTCTLSGYFAPQYGESWDQYKPDEFIKKRFLDKVDAQATLDTQSCKLDSAGNFVIAATYSLPNAVRNLDNNLVMKAPVFYLADNPFKSIKRSFPVDFNFPFTYHNVVKVTSARKIANSALPANVTLTIGGVTFERKSVMQEGTAVIDTKLSISQPVFMPSEYAGLREIFEKIGQAQAEELALTVE